MPLPAAPSADSLYTTCTTNNGVIIIASAPFNTITATNTAAGSLSYTSVSCDATCTQVGR